MPSSHFLFFSINLSFFLFDSNHLFLKSDVNRESLLCRSERLNTGQHVRFMISFLRYSILHFNLILSDCLNISNKSFLEMFSSFKFDPKERKI